MEAIHIYDLSIFEKKLIELRPAMALITIYIQNKDKHNKLKLKKNDIATAFNVSYRTVTNWIKILMDAGVIKFKYSGWTCLNPFFCYDGTLEDWERAKIEWHNFKSDNIQNKRRMA